MHRGAQPMGYPQNKPKQNREPWARWHSKNMFKKNVNKWNEAKKIGISCEQCSKPLCHSMKYWLVKNGIPRSWIIIILNMLGTIIPYCNHQSTIIYQSYIVTLIFTNIPLLGSIIPLLNHQPCQGFLRALLMWFHHEKTRRGISGFSEISCGWQFHCQSAKYPAKNDQFFAGERRYSHWYQKTS